MFTRDEAWNRLCDWTKTESLRKHCPGGGASRPAAE